MTTVTLSKQGDTVGVTLPAETRQRMGFEAGQELMLVELADGVKLVRRDRRLERRLQLAREVLDE